MIYDTILRIKEQYSESEGRRKADEKLAESERRLKYLRLEIDQIVSRLDLGSPGGELTSVLSSNPIITTPFDYWKPAGCLTGEALEFKLAEIYYKINIEERIKLGAEKIIRALGALQATPAKMKESLVSAQTALEQSEAKLHLLNAAYKSYLSLRVERPGKDTGSDEDADSGHLDQEPGKLVGRLTFKVLAVSKASLDDGHSLITTCSLDGHEKYTGKLKRTEKCLLSTEGFTLELNGTASYFELLFRTKEHQPVGILFFRLAWLGDGRTPFSCEHQLSMEPDGLVQLSIDYLPKMTPISPMNSAIAPSGLTRANAIQRKRTERLGHELYSKKFYNLMKCAVCHEFVYQTAALQCDSTTIVFTSSVLSCSVQIFLS